MLGILPFAIFNTTDGAGNKVTANVPAPVNITGTNTAASNTGASNTGASNTGASGSP